MFVLQGAFVFTLLILWISSDTIRQQKNLWVLFFASFPAEFFIALIPHEPILLYFSKFHHPFIVSLVAVVGTVLAEILNYVMITYLAELKSFERIHQNKMTTTSINLFKKAPFPAILVAGFTPVPFYPLRFLAALAHYPVWKYALAVFLSRAPRFYILAALGHEIHIPDSVLVILFIVLLIISYFLLLRSRFRRFRMGTSHPNAAKETVSCYTQKGNVQEGQEQA